MSTHNLMEEIVKKCLKDLLETSPELAGCSEQQQADITAIVLNALPPKYVGTEKGEMFVKTQQRAQIETDVYRELSLAVKKVMNDSRNSIL